MFSKVPFIKGTYMLKIVAATILLNAASITVCHFQNVKRTSIILMVWIFENVHQLNV